MKVSLVKEMRAVDRRAGEEYGLPEVVLMENAGRQTAGHLEIFELSEFHSNRFFLYKFALFSVIIPYF